MTIIKIQAMSLTTCGKPAGTFFPQPLENPTGFPQTHSLGDELFGLDFL